jgi:hypothetical protein
MRKGSVSSKSATAGAALRRLGENSSSPAETLASPLIARARRKGSKGRTINEKRGFNKKHLTFPGRPHMNCPTRQAVAQQVPGDSLETQAG